MDDFFFEEGLDVTKLQEMNRGTVSPKGAKAFKTSLINTSKKHAEYFQRVGSGFSNVTIEIKNELDKKVLPELISVFTTVRSI